MIRKEKIEAGSLGFARTKAGCTDPRTGKLLPAYLLGDLGDQQTAVDAHLKKCRLCSLAVANWRSAETALRREVEADQVGRVKLNA